MREGFNQDKLSKWLENHDIVDMTRIIRAIGKKVRNENENRTSVAGVGFCWGAWVLARAIKSGLKLDGFCAVHPSLRLEELGGGNLSHLAVYLINIPLIMITAGNDPDNLKPGGSLYNLLVDHYKKTDLNPQNAATIKDVSRYLVFKEYS